MDELNTEINRIKNLRNNTANKNQKRQFNIIIRNLLDNVKILKKELIFRKKEQAKVKRLRNLNIQKIKEKDREIRKK